MNVSAPALFQSLTRFLAMSHPGERANVQRSAKTAQVVLLPMNGTFDVEQPYRRQIQCLRGSIWITQIGDARDVVVTAGSSYIAERRAPIFIQALVPAEFEVAPGRCAGEACRRGTGGSGVQGGGGASSPTLAV